MGAMRLVRMRSKGTLHLPPVCIRLQVDTYHPSAPTSAAPEPEVEVLLDAPEQQVNEDENEEI